MIRRAAQTLRCIISNKFLLSIFLRESKDEIKHVSSRAEKNVIIKCVYNKRINMCTHVQI